jgi:hypothetical protein
MVACAAGDGMDVFVLAFIRKAKAKRYHPAPSLSNRPAASRLLWGIRPLQEVVATIHR